VVARLPLMASFVCYKYMTNKYLVYVLYTSLFIIGLFILSVNPFFGFLYFLIALLYIRKKQKNKKKLQTVNKEVPDLKSKVAEYKRVCNECGKIWHSLVEREKIIDPNACNLDTLGEFSSCGPNSASAQYRRNLQALENTLSKLRKCPVCSSTNYTETIICYEKKQ